MALWLRPCRPRWKFFQQSALLPSEGNIVLGRLWILVIMIVPLMPNFGRDCIVVKDPKRSIFFKLHRPNFGTRFEIELFWLDGSRCRLSYVRLTHAVRLYNMYVCENVWSWHRTVMSSKNVIKSCNFIFVEFRNFRFNWVLASPLIFVIASWKHQYIYYLYVRDNGIKNWFFLAIYMRVNEM